MLARIVAALIVLMAFFGQPVSSAAETGFLDRVVVVEGNEYRYQVYVPRQYDDSTEWPVILSLHGAGSRGADGISQTDSGLATALRRYPNRYPAIVVFPQSPIEGPGWQELGGRIAMASLDQAMQEFSSDEERVYLTGYSQGGNGTWYLAYHHAERFAAAVPVCGYVDEFMGPASGAHYPPISLESSTGAFSDIAAKVAEIPIWIFHGDADDLVSVEQSRNMASALEAIGAPYRYTEFPGVDHNAWDAAYATEGLATWLFAQRRQ